MLAALATLFASVAEAQNVRDGALSRIAETGEMRVGTRAQARPFAFKDSSGRFAGFSVDFLHYIGREIGEQLGRPVDLDFRAVTTSNRLRLLANEELDLVCGLTTPTWPREKKVDFTVPFFVDGTRILTYREYGQAGMSRLENRRVGVLEDSTTERIVALSLPNVDLVGFDSMDAAMSALENRNVAAIANIGILLETLRMRSSQSVSMMLVPRSGSLNREAMSCAVPQNQSALRDAVNRAIADSFTGLRELSGPYADIYFRWFGVDGIVYYPLTEKRRDTLLASRIWLR